MFSPGLADSVVDHPEVHGRSPGAKEAGPSPGILRAGTPSAKGADVQKGQTPQPHGWLGSGEYTY